MSLGTLNTILNSAPLIIQGANRLLKLIKERKGVEQEEVGDDIPNTLEGLKNQIYHINSRLESGYQSDLEQIKLIEELAKQNELLASAMNRINRQLNIMVIIILVTIVCAVTAIVISL